MFFGVLNEGGIFLSPMNDLRYAYKTLIRNFMRKTHMGGLDIYEKILLKWTF
jgi:hypothetical protein